MMQNQGAKFETIRID